MILSNMHSHTSFCDGDNTVAEMVASAANKGFKSFGFSGHSPLPYPNDYAMTDEALESYIAEVNKAKLEYNGKLDILLGIEWDLDSLELSYPFDYTIGAVHQLHPFGKCYAVDNTLEEFEKCLLEYIDVFSMLEDFYTLTVKSAKRKGVTIVGHFDLITKFNRDCRFFNTSEKKYRDLALSAANEILNSCPDIIFEMNTGAMSRGYKSLPYTDEFIVRHLSQKNANVMVNSDTHSVNTLSFGFDLTYKLLKENGFKEICILTKNGITKSSCYNL